MLIFRILALLLAFAIVNGCSASPASTPTEAAPQPKPKGQGDLPTPTRASAATDIPRPPTAAAQARPSAAPATPAPPSIAPPVTVSLAFSYPIGTPGKPLGDGFFIRHGAQAENTWYNPGYWHTGEDWYAIEGDTAGAQVYSIADGGVVYAGANYPGRVVIIRHDDGLYSMYGHLDPKLDVASGQHVSRGDLIGTVLRRSDTTPNHLHFEVRTFLTTAEVNGGAPRYGFRCGVNCPPGPGYWPMSAPDVPSDLGWRNPTHVINRRMIPQGAVGAVVAAANPVSRSVTLWSAPPNDTEREALGTLELRPGERFTLLEVRAGAEDTRETSALAYLLWYHIGLPDGRAGWVQAAVPSTFEIGGDGRPSSVSFNFYPAISAPT